MKKLLIGLSIATLSNMSLASEGSGFYLKANVGANKMSSAKQEHEEMSNTKSKSEISPTFIIGTGYYMNDMIRTELTFDYSKVSFKEGKSNFNLPGDNLGETINGQISLNRKASIYSLMVNSYIDMPATENIKIFVGAGVGIAKIKEKINGSLTGVVLSGNTIIGTGNENNSYSSKCKNNFAYSLTIGSAVKISSNVNIEIAYSWRDFGSTSYYKDSDGDTLTKNRYNGHSVMTGIRFDL